MGCQGDNKTINMNNTVVDTNSDLDLETDNVVMHVETAAATSVKSVIVAFQVSRGLENLFIYFVGVA